jgi:hypothetical protein
LLCGHFGCLPHDLDEMEDEKYWQGRQFLRLKRESERVRGLQQGFYG